MRKSETNSDRRLLVALFFLFLLVAVLGIAQISWVRSAAITEGIHMREAMWLRAFRAVESATGETWYFYDLVREAADDFPVDSSEEVYRQVLDEWMGNTEYPKLLLGLYEATVNGDSEWTFRRFDADLGTLADVSPGEAERLSVWVRSEREKTSPFGFVVNTHDTTGDRLVVVEMDEEYLLNTVLPEYLEDEGGRYGVRIQNEEGTTVYERDAPESGTPDVTAPVVLFRPPPNRIFGRIDDEKNVFFATERYRRDDGSQSIPDGPAGPKLELFRIGRSIMSYIRLRAVVNVLFATSVLVLVMAALVIVFRMFRRSRVLLVQQREFVSLTGHELRTPVTIIRSAAENLRKGIVGEEEQILSYGDVIVRNSERLGRGIDNIMTLAGLQQRNSEPGEAPATDVESTIRAALEQLEPLAEKDDAWITFEVLPGIGRRRIDPDTLSVVIENLVRNALLHAIPLCAPEDRTVSVRLAAAPYGRIRILVSDCGPGIPRRDRRRLFEPFTRSKSSRDRQVPGHGLGLHIVSRIVGTMGGHVSVESPLNAECVGSIGSVERGTRFVVLLDAQPVPGETEGAREAGASAEGEGTATRGG